MEGNNLKASPLSLEPKGTFFMAETASKELKKCFVLFCDLSINQKLSHQTMLFLMYDSDYYEQLYKPDLFKVTLRSFLNKNVLGNTYAERAGKWALSY